MAFDFATAKPETSFDFGTAKPVSSEPEAKPIGMAERIGQGMMDPITGGAQLLTHALPEPVVKAGNDLNNWLAKHGLVGEIPKGGLDEKIKKEESTYEQRRQASGSTGIDWARLIGNVASPANLAVAARTPEMASLGGRALAGLGQGAAMGSMAPVTQGDFAQEKGKQLLAGGLTGGAVPLGGAGLSRVISPKIAPEVQELRKMGVSLTPGQTAGGWVRAFEEKLKSVPFVGDIIKSSERRGIEDFNRAAINKSLEPIGARIPKNIPIGHDAIGYAGEQISNAYDSLLPKMKGEIDIKFTSDLQKIRKMGQAGLPPDKADQLSRIIDREVISRFTKNGLANGDTIKQIESKLGEIASPMRRSDDYDMRAMAGAVQEVQASLRNMLERINPTQKGELEKVNKAYAEFLRVQTAAARQGAKDGLFSPNQYLSAVRQMDPSKRKSAFAKGGALGQDLAKTGQKVLSPTVPDSGTAGRGLVAGLALGAPGLIHPMAGLGAAWAAAYSRPGQAAINALIAGAPQSRAQLAQHVTGALPWMSIPAIDLALQGRQ